MVIARKERVWFRDPLGLFSEDRIAHFMPEKNTTLAVQLNALLRLSLYFAVLMVLFRHYSLAIYIPAGVATLTYALYIANHGNATSWTSKGVSTEDGTTEGMTKDGAACTTPTRSNPFMNVMMGDYTKDPKRPAACDLSSTVTTEDADSMFANNLYRDVDDVFVRRTSSHMFYAMPNTQIPNDQGLFAQWCYGSPPTLKEGGHVNWTPNLQTGVGIEGDGGGPHVTR